jgi:hypothetical protein
MNKSMRSAVVTLCAALGILVTPDRLPAQCEAEWKGTHILGIDGSVYALASYDPDGPGPESSHLIVGGLFGMTDEDPASNIAMWNGSKWLPIGAPGDPDGTNGKVNVMISVDLDGAGPNNPVLIIGGEFTSVGGVSANRVAIWDGMAWSSLPHGSGNGVDGVVNALMMFDDDDAGPNPPALFIGGSFASGGGVTANNIVKWDGVNWSPLGSPEGVNGQVYAMEVFDVDGDGPGSPTLIVGGDFATTSSGATVNRIASWNGTSWSALGQGVNSSVYTLEVIDLDGEGPELPVLVAAGLFTKSGLLISVTGSVLKWNGVNWSSIVPAGETSPLGVRSFLYVPPDGEGSPPILYAAGNFDHIGSTDVNYFAKWTGTTWTAGHTQQGAVGLTGPTHAILLHDLDESGPAGPTLVFGGEFDRAGNVIAPSIAQHDGQLFHPWPNPSGKLGGAGGDITTMTLYDDEGGNPYPELYVGGTFITIGEARSYNFAKWDGCNWICISPVATGDCVPYSMTSIDIDGPGPEPRVLVVGGFLTRIGGVNVSGVAKWDGSTWSALTGVPSSQFVAMAAFDEDGDGPEHEKLFMTGGGGIRRWNGTSSTVIGTIAGASPLRINCMITWDDDGPGPNPEALYVGGKFDSISGVLVGGIAKWNGTSWSGLLGPLGLGVTGEVMALAVHDEDGDGPELPKLFVGGDFLQAGGVTVNRIARWSGSAWSALEGTNGTGVNNFVRAFASLDDDGPGPNPPSLLMGGGMSMAGAVPAYGACRWDGQRWWALDGPPDYGVNAIRQGCLFAHDDDGPGPRPKVAFAGGWFSSAGGVTAIRVAKWGRDYALGAGSPDGQINGSEIQAFVNVLLAPPATGEQLCIYDFDQDSEVNVSDVPYFTSILVGG